MRSSYSRCRSSAATSRSAISGSRRAAPTLRRPVGLAGALMGEMLGELPTFIVPADAPLAVTMLALALAGFGTVALATAYGMWSLDHRLQDRGDALKQFNPRERRAGAEGSGSRARRQGVMRKTAPRARRRRRTGPRGVVQWGRQRRRRSGRRSRDALKRFNSRAASGCGGSPGSFWTIRSYSGSHPSSRRPCRRPPTGQPRLCNPGKLRGMSVCGPLRPDMAALWFTKGGNT